MSPKKPRRSPSLSTTGNPNWGTPSWLLDRARTFCDGSIALDPCGRTGSLVGAEVEFHGLALGVGAHRVDGLVTPWWSSGRSSAGRRFALAWVNPPYTRGIIDLWAARCSEQGRHLEVLAILPLRPSSQWFRAWCFPPQAAGVCFLNRRVKFEGASSGVPWESAVVHWGTRRQEFLDAYGDVGTIWQRRW